MDEVDRARARRDKAREELIEAQATLVEAILAAVALKCSLSEIAQRAGVTSQRISAIKQKMQDGTPPINPG